MNCIVSWISERRAAASGLALLALGCGAEAPQEFDEFTQEPVIFGQDERQDYGAMSSADQRLSRSVAIHVKDTAVSCTGATCSLATFPFTVDPEVFNRLCQNVRFRGQKRALDAQCTGWLVGPDLLLTAGHCFTPSFTCANARYVFGFSAAANGGSEVTSFAAKDVYSCGSIVAQSFTGFGTADLDYALVKLDRTVTDRTPFVVRHGDVAQSSTPLLAFGHPSGLPIKLTRNATLRDNSFVQRFYYNADIFGVNSGGPALNLNTGVAEGIVVTQPGPRFVPSTDAQGSCSAYRVCPDTGCTSGDIVFRLTGAYRVNRVPGIPLHAALIQAVL